jgi:hypothetical protein
MTILDIGKGRLFKCDLVSTDVWLRLAAHQSPAEIARGLNAKYQVAPEQMEQHIVAFLTQLAAFGLVIYDDGRKA